MEKNECCKKNAEIAKKAAAKLHILLADIMVAKEGFYNVHWHVKGKGFLTIHEFSEKLYDFLNERYDVIAERIIQLNETIPTSIEKRIEKRTIKTLDHGFINTRDGWQLVKYYLRGLTKTALCTKNCIDELGDSVSSAILDEDIVELEKSLWLAKASCPCNELETKVESVINHTCKK